MKALKSLWRVVFILLIIALDLLLIASIANCDVVINYSQDQSNNQLLVEGMVQFSTFFTELSKISMNLIVRISGASVNPDGTYNLAYDLIGPNFTPDIVISIIPIIGFFLIVNGLFAVAGSANNRLSCVITSAIVMTGCVLFLFGPNPFKEFLCRITINGEAMFAFALPIGGISSGLFVAIILALVAINLIFVLIFGGKKKEKTVVINS